MSLLQVKRSGVRALDVIQGKIFLPAASAGRVYELELDLQDDDPALAVGELVTLDVAGSWSMACAVTSTAEIAGRAFAALVAGRGGLARSIRPTQFARCTAADVARNICTGAAEELETSQALGVSFERYTLAGGSAGAALGRLAQAVGVPWRMIMQGRVRFEALAFPAVTVDGDLIADDGYQRTYAVERPVLLPALTVDGERYGDVEHVIRPDAIRTRIRRQR